MPPIHRPPPRLVSKREPEHDYSVDHHEGRLIILTNSDGAEDYRIVETRVASPGRENWHEIEQHRPGRLIVDVVAFKDFLVRLEREDGLPRIVVRRFESGEEHANMRAQRYPHILALAGLTDPPITYWEPAKWIAKLRELATSDGLILLRTNMEAGHAGASGRFESLKEVAFACAFALKIARP